MGKQKSAGNLELEEFWSQFRLVSSLDNHGQLAPALEGLRKLRGHVKKRTFDPQRQTDFAYAVMLLKTNGIDGEWDQAHDILWSLSTDTNVVAEARPHILAELACANNLRRGKFECSRTR